MICRTEKPMQVTNLAVAVFIIFLTIGARIPKSALILLIIVSSFLISQLINKLPSTQPSVPVVMICISTPCFLH